MRSIDEVASVTRMLLRASLEAAVPLWYFELRGQPKAVLERRARQCGQVLSEKGDCLQFGGKSKSSKAATAEAFNRLAEGLAAATLLGQDVDKIWALFGDDT
jgi:hypothetical protein